MLWYPASISDRDNGVDMSDERKYKSAKVLATYEFRHMYPHTL
jgi:hypothetical protein